MEGATRASISSKRRPFTLRWAIAWTVLALAYATGLSFYKSAMLDGLAREGLESLKVRHPQVLSLFQASFYFFYEEQFLPGVKKALDESAPDARLRQVVVLSSDGAILFDSVAPPKSPNSQGAGQVFPHSEVIGRLASREPSIFVSGFEVQILMPSGQYGILYSFDGRALRMRLASALVLGLLFFGLLRWVLARSFIFSAARSARERWARFWGLKAKFLCTIVLINLMTSGIVFVTLSEIQTREQTQRIEKESILFSQFSTAEVVSSFTNYFYFYYPDRFMPAMKKIIASNENLLGIRVISFRTRNVLFDSERASVGIAPAEAGDGARSEYAPEFEGQLLARDLANQFQERSGERRLSVAALYRNENQEPVFIVEYVFGFQTLANSIRVIRRQILIDLIPSMTLGLLIAMAFAQLLIRPIRRLVTALQKVSAGDYDVSVDVHRSDEIGELVTAFNSMTGELRKKKELRKYLSDSTYRQVMEAPDMPEGHRLGGSRVEATILFSDIRNFVGHCENLEAEEITSMLNDYFSEMVEVVYKHGGEVDKFIGDALLAVFYSTDSGAGSSTTALQAIYCALEMRERLAEFNERRKNAHKSVIEIGVGITHGEIISGPIGSKDRMDFTVIGDVVNLANRIEKLSKKGRHSKIVFSHHVEEKVRGLLDYEEMSVGKVQGKEEEVTIFELIGIRDLSVLVENLRVQDVALKRRSVELLGQSRNALALPHVLGVLESEDEGTRVQAALAVVKLVERDDARAVDPMLSRLKNEASDKVISALVSALGRICSTERILEIAYLLDSPNERIVANAVESLGLVRSQRCTDLILPKIASRNNRVKANAAMALFAAGHMEVIDTLKPMLMHSDPAMRSSAAFAIGELTLIAEQTHLLQAWKTHPSTVKMFLGELQECVPMLVALLKDAEASVRRQSIIALGKIKDKSAVLPIIDMLDPRWNSEALIRDVTQALRSIGSHKLVRDVIAKLST